MDEASVTKLGEKLQKDDPTPEIFDEIQRNVQESFLHFDLLMRESFNVQPCPVFLLLNSL